MENLEDDSAKSMGTEQSSISDPVKHQKVRKRLQQLKEKVEANQKIRAFKDLLQKKDNGRMIALSTEKMQALPLELKEDPDEALLYLYYSVRYYDEHMYKVIL